MTNPLEDPAFGIGLGPCQRRDGARKFDLDQTADAEKREMIHRLAESLGVLVHIDGMPYGAAPPDLPFSAPTSSGPTS